MPRIVYQIKDMELIPNHYIVNKFVNYLIRVFKKIIDTCLSVKVWCLVGISWLCTWLVVKSYITGANFASIEIALITTVMAAREFAKMTYIYSAGTYTPTNNSNPNPQPADCLKPNDTTSSGVIVINGQPPSSDDN